MIRTLACLLFLGLALIGLPSGAAHAATICPTTANTNSDCGFIITINADGTFSGAAVTNAAPYDGSDDVLIGVINNETTAFTGSILLSGSGNGGGLFAFDGDGICTYTSASYCSTAPTGYEGLNNTFANINQSATSGDVVFNVGGGISSGGTAFFSLESSPASISTGGGIVIGGGGTGVPEPASLALIGAGLVALAGIRKLRA